MTFPFQHRVGNHQNPTLLPNFYRPVAVNGSIALTSPADVIGLDPLTPSAGAAVIGGTITVGDTVTVNIANPVLGTAPVAVTYTVVTGDTIDTLGYGLAQALNTNATLGRFGFFGQHDPATHALNIGQMSAVGNYTVLTESVSGAATETVTLTQMSGGAGPVTPVENFIFSDGHNIRSYWFGVPVQVNYATLTALVTQGQPVI